MKKMLSTMNTNSVMKNGLKITTSALVDGMWQLCETGVPVYVAHDQSRQTGWTTPLAVHFEPGIVRAINLTQLHETHDEEEQNRHRRLAFITKLVEQKQEVVDELKHKLYSLCNGQEKIVYSPQIAIFETDLAVRLAPDIFEIANQDRDGLVPIANLNPIGPGVYQIDDYVIFAHEYFRRALFRLNTLNTEFLKNLQNLDSDMLPRVALDRDMVGLASDYVEPIELMYSWGPSFKSDFEKIDIGVTVHEADDGDRFFSGISKTEFWWKYRDDVYEFEVEEIADRDHPYYKDDKQFACRYSHSRVPNEASVANHLDGAIRMYSEEKMIDRLDVPINRAGKNSLYTKLWRIDGDVDIITWKSLISDYFRGNTLVGEYLGGIDKNPYLTSANNQINNGIENPKERYVPYVMRANNGIRATISYQLLEDSDKDKSLSHYLVSNDFLSDGTNATYALDSRLIDFYKLLVSEGASVSPLDEYTIVKYSDRYINFPTILHSEINLRSNVDLTLKVIAKIISFWAKRNLDLVIAFSIGFPIEDRSVFISILGNITDIRTWLSNPLANIPIQKKELDKWSTNLSDYLDKTYDAKYDSPPLSETLHESGLLAILRKQAKELDIEFIKDEKGIRYRLDQRTLSEIELELMKAGEINLSAGCMIQKMTCMNCKSDYLNCKCNSISHRNISRRIDKYQLIYPPHWVD